MHMCFLGALRWLQAFQKPVTVGRFDLEQNGPSVVGGNLFDVQQIYVNVFMQFLWCFLFVYLLTASVLPECAPMRLWSKLKIVKLK